MLRGWQAEDLDLILSHGYRHFGDYFFIPHCQECRQCLPARVRVDDFHANAAQRRVLNRGMGLTWRFTDPEPSETAFHVYLRHQTRFREKGPSTFEEYAASFCLETPGAKQLSLFHEENLIGVCHLDQGKNCLSAVYAYFDPCYAPFSPGTFMILAGIYLARSLSREYLYLGYFIEGSPHMRYKGHFYPMEILAGSDDHWIIGRDAKGLWRDPAPWETGFYRAADMNTCLHPVRKPPAASI